MRTKLRSKILAAISTVVIALGMVTVTAAAANAHTPNVSATCTTLSVNLQYYDSSVTNTVKVTIDNVVVDTNLDFGGHFTKNYTFSDKTVAHTWLVEYTAGDQSKNPNANWSGSQSGTSTPCVSHDNDKVPFCHAKPADTAANGWNMPPAADPGIIFQAGHATEHDADIIPAFDYWTESHGVWTLNHYAGKNLTTVWGGATGAEILANGCMIPDLKDATAVISITPATCSTAEVLVLGAISNATWGTPTLTTGPGTYSVTATANAGHAFSNGSSTMVFGGTLAGVLSPTSQACAPPPPCLPISAVSYTYSNSTNSGVITVAQLKGYSDTLCKPFWVTAASWTFDGNTSWPQTLDKWNPANGGNKIDSVGTYPYGADVGCGQGDIYATFSAPGVPKPNPEILNGPHNPYPEHFLHNMGFTGPSPTYMQRNASTCNANEVKVVPAVTFTDVCGTNDDGIVGGVDTAEINYTIIDNRVNGVGTVIATAAPKTGYTFATGAYTGPWSHTFTDEPCPIVVKTVPAVTFTDECGIDNDGIVGGTDTAEIDYTITDNRVNGVGLVTVTAAPQSGYVFENGAYTGPWTYTFTNEPCVVDNSITPTVSDQTCTPVQSVGSAGYTYADGGITVNLDANLEYTITGIDGTVYGPTVVTTAFTALSPGKYKVDVKALNGYVLKGGGTTATFERTVGAGLCAVVFGDPYAVDETCTEQGTTAPGYIWVDFSGNLASEISYQITGGPTPVDYTATQEINNLEPGDYTVTVTAKPGFKLASTMKSVWNFTIHGVETCDLETHPLISTTASYKNLTCSSDGSYTLADTEGVVWFVNGSSTPTPPGTYKVTGATTVNIEAQTTGPDYGWERDAQTKWTFDFTNPVDCLPTLAFTGSDGGNLGLLLAGGFLLFGGTIVAFERRFRANVR
ncbi:MAG: hypothetical protein J0H56_11140 [Micrococcales bacterium]|nr:hypothetical protein [Micrococcales bacterium]